MFFLSILASAGLFLIFLEFFLPGGVMAIGGALLLLASIFVCYMQEGWLTLLLYFFGLILMLYLVIQGALFIIKRRIQQGPPKDF